MWVSEYKAQRSALTGASSARLFPDARTPAPAARVRPRNSRLVIGGRWKGMESTCRRRAPSSRGVRNRHLCQIGSDDGGDRWLAEIVIRYPRDVLERHAFNLRAVRAVVRKAEA